MDVNVNAVLRGIVNNDMKQVVAKALEKDFTLGEVPGTTRYHLIWPANGQKVGFDITTADEHAWKGFARQLERASGKRILPIPQHKTSHEELAKIVVVEPQFKGGSHVEERVREYKVLFLEFRINLMVDTDKKDVPRAIQIARRMGELEKLFNEIGLPIPNITPELAKEFEYAS